MKAPILAIFFPKPILGENASEIAGTDVALAPAVRDELNLGKAQNRERWISLGLCTLNMYIYILKYMYKL